jgi:CBS-domain-containing membrane protein
MAPKVSSKLRSSVRIACIGVVCIALICVAQSAFAPAVSSGRWEFVFIAIAGIGLLLGVCARAYEFARRRKRAVRAERPARAPDPR